MRGAASGRTVHIVHSDNYKTSFTYNLLSRTYKMQMYSHAAGGFENTVDELNGKQLSFDNLLVCFAPIAAYPGDSGDVQQVSYISGGEAYFFSRGGVRTGRWEKASPEHPLKVYDDTGAEMLFNRGKTYLAIVDDDECPRPPASPGTYRPQPAGRHPVHGLSAIGRSSASWLCPPSCPPVRPEPHGIRLLQRQLPPESRRFRIHRPSSASGRCHPHRRTDTALSAVASASSRCSHMPSCSVR